MLFVAPYLYKPVDINRIYWQLSSGKGINNNSNTQTIQVTANTKGTRFPLGLDMILGYGAEILCDGINRMN